MSEENEGEEDKQKDDFSGSEEFDFFFPFTKLLVLDLPIEEDRVLASAWVQKLEAEPETTEDKRLRLKYLKLLLFALQRGRLSGIFKKQPPSGSLEPFPQGFSIFDMANWMLEEDDAPACGGGDAGHLPYTIELSNDLREFIASQEIPNFGVQMYYAWSSDDAIDKWSFFDEEKFPQYILDKIKQLQEIKSDETTSAGKNGFLIKKKGCDLPLPDKCSQKKVKSPQEIERSQRRSFHTYMGLVGRLGNFDKCDDDPKKFQRQDSRKGKYPRRIDQKKCPGNGGEAKEEENFDNPVPNLGGLNSLNRPCLCPNPCQYSACPDHHSKGEPLPKHYENPQTVDRNCGFNTRPDIENSQWTSTVIKSLPPRHMREQCLDNAMPETVAPQKRSASPRPRSSSPNRRILDCSPEDNSGGFSNVGICTCKTSRCPCPCPRITPKVSAQKTPSTSHTGGRGGVDPSRTFIKSPKRDPCFNENRGIGTYLTSFTAPDPCSPPPRRPDMSPVGGRTNASSGIRPIQPEVIHCYDNQNPDPALTKIIEPNTGWVKTVGGGNKYMNTDLKLACRRDQLIAAAQENKFKMASRRELFNSQQQSPPPPLLGTACQQSPGTDRITSPLESHPLCEYSPPSEASELCPSGQQRVYPQQNYLECDGSAPFQTRYGFYETCGRQISDTYKKPAPHTTARLKNASAYYPGGPFAVRNDTGRLANMVNVLQGIKQKTEIHREKCAQMRSPVNDMLPETRMCHSPQPPETNICPPDSLNEAFIGLPPSDEECPQPSSHYPGYFPSRLGNYQEDECDYEYEEEDECDSSESLEACPQETSPNRLPMNDMESNKTLIDDPECFRKTPTPKNYGVKFTEADQCYDPKYVNLERAHQHRINVSPRDFGQQRTSPERMIRPGSGGSTPVEFFTMPDYSGPSTQTQWVSPRTVPFEACMNEESPYNVAQETDIRDCHPQISGHGTSRNRYFEESRKLRLGQTYQNVPVTSTPLQHYNRNFKDQGDVDLSTIRLPSSRYA